jgi:hypothetical protein
MSEYIVTIDLGDEAMQEPWQVAQALYTLADSLANSGSFDARKIRDYNGNTVGHGGVTG